MWFSEMKLGMRLLTFFGHLLAQSPRGVGSSNQDGLRYLCGEAAWQKFFRPRNDLWRVSNHVLDDRFHFCKPAAPGRLQPMPRGDLLPTIVPILSPHRHRRFDLVR